MLPFHSLAGVDAFLNECNESEKKRKSGLEDHPVPTCGFTLSAVLLFWHMITVSLTARKRGVSAVYGS